MVTVRQWFENIAWVLNDEDGNFTFERYPLERMIQAYNDAMCLAAKYRSDLFTELRVVELDAGKYQDVRGCCNNVLDVMDQVDAKGNILKELKGARPTRSTTKRNWKKPSCLRRDHAPDGYLIDNINIDANLNGRFTVDPPVPCGVRAYVMVKCVTDPCPLTTRNENDPFDAYCDLSVAARHYVLAWLTSGDRFDNAMGQDKQYHYRMFFDILGITLEHEERIESPERA